MVVTPLAPSSRLLQRAQELGQLDQIIHMYVSGQTASIDLMLAGMQCGGRAPVKVAEFDVARTELQTVVEDLFVQQGRDMQDDLFNPEVAGDMNYLQTFEMIEGGAPKAAVAAFVTGWMMGLHVPYPHIRARILVSAISQRLQGQEVPDDARALH